VTGYRLLLVRRRHEGLRRLLEEKDREAGVPGGVLAVPDAPGAVGALGAEEELRAFGVPVVVAQLVGAVEDAGALDAVEVVEEPVLSAAGVVLDGELRAQPGHAVLDGGVLLPVLLEHVVVDRERARAAGGHRAVGVALAGTLVGPALGLAGGLAGARADGALPELVGAALFRVDALDEPLHGEVDRRLGDQDARVVAGAEAERGVLRVRVVALTR